MRIVELLRTGKTDRIPIWMMRQAGRYLPEYRAIRANVPDFLSLCYSPDLACEVTLQPVRRYGFDAAILFSDILVIPDALGQKVAFVEGEGPRLEPITDEGAIQALNASRVMDHLAPVFETVKRVRAALDRDTALLGFCGAPWTVASYMVAGSGTPDQGPARLWAYREPEIFAGLIDLLVGCSIDYLCAQVDAGADALQIFDSWAGNLPERELRRWSLEPLARIVAGVKARHPDTPVIVFPRAIGGAYGEAARITRADAMGLDTACAFSVGKALQDDNIAVQGNLDPLVLLTGGRAMEQAVEAILEAFGKGPFIFNLGHGIVPQTPAEHVAQVVEQVRAYRPR